MAPSGRAYTAGMGRNGVWPRVLVAFLVVPWIQAGIDAAGRKDKDQEPAKDKEKPHLRLVVDASVGFPPVTVTATGWLTGVDPRDANFCHAAVTDAESSLSAAPYIRASTGDSSKRSRAISVIDEEGQSGL